MADFTLVTLWLTIYFSVSFSRRLSTQFLLQPKHPFFERLAINGIVQYNCSTIPFTSRLVVCEDVVKCTFSTTFTVQFNLVVALHFTANQMYKEALANIDDSEKGMPFSSTRRFLSVINNSLTLWFIETACRHV